MKYSKVTDCKYTTANKEFIGCQVTFDTLGTVYFVASCHDVETHGKEIYQRAVAGEFGLIADFKPYIPPNLTLEEKQAKVRSERDSLLLQLDSFISNPLRWADLDEQEKLNLSKYRVELLNVPQQERFPDSVVWPEKPASIVKITKQVEMTFSLVG